MAAVTSVFFGMGQKGIGDWSKILGLLKIRGRTAPQIAVCPFENKRLASGEDVALIHLGGRAQFCCLYCVPSKGLGALGSFNTENADVDTWRRLLCETIHADLVEIAEEERIAKSLTLSKFAMA